MQTENIVLDRAEAQTVLSIATLAVFWTWDMGDPKLARGLAISFGWFLMNGGADAHPGAIRLVNQKAERVYVKSGREIGQRIGEEASRLGKQPDEVLNILLEEDAAEVIFVTREAVWAYCGATGIARPSFWAQPRGGSKSDDAIRAEMVALRRAEQAAGAELSTADQLADQLGVARKVARRLNLRAPSNVYERGEILP
jgi:hypothetical protein